MLLCLLRAGILYGILLLIIRLMGKRQLGEMEPSELVVAMLLADLAAVPMQDLGIPLLAGIVPILAILALELLCSVLTYHSITLRKILCGKPVILIDQGKLLQSSLKKTRLTPDELIEQLREKGIVDLSTVKFAILETNGQISAIKYDNIRDGPELPITLVSNGKLLRENLLISGFTREWIETKLQEYNCNLEQVLLLMTDPAGKVYLAKNEDAS